MTSRRPIPLQLADRAARILSDGKRHSTAAISWARDTVWAARRTAQDSPFTLRELSLGAADVYAEAA